MAMAATVVAMNQSRDRAAANSWRHEEGDAINAAWDDYLNQEYVK